MWEYRCSVGRVIDTFNLELIVDVGFDSYRRIRLSLPSQASSHVDQHIDRGFTEQWVADREGLDTDFPFIVRTTARGRNESWVGEIESVEGGGTLSDALDERFSIALNHYAMSSGPAADISRPD